MPHNNTGCDIHSTTPWTPGLHRVKGRIAEPGLHHHQRSPPRQERPAAHRLVMVEVSPDPEQDQLRYIAEHFRSINLGDLAATDGRLNWAKTWGEEHHHADPAGTDRPTKGHLVTNLKRKLD